MFRVHRPAIIRTRFVQLLVVIGALAHEAEHGLAQTVTEQSFPSVEDVSDVPCPPGFTSFYDDDTFGRFWGSSRMTMAQWDQYHTYRFFTYEFYGKTTDQKTAVRGTHHVNALQCTDAAWSYWSETPAQIALLHNARFTSLACAESGGKPGGGIAALQSSECQGAGGGGGGGEGTVPVRCYTVQIDHYWYYPDTGEVEYRYTETQTFCESSQA